MGLFKEANWQKKNKKKKHQTSRMLKCFVLKKKIYKKNNDLYICQEVPYNSLDKYLGKGACTIHPSISH